MTGPCKKFFGLRYRRKKKWGLNDDDSLCGNLWCSRAGDRQLPQCCNLPGAEGRVNSHARLALPGMRPLSSPLGTDSGHQLFGVDRKVQQMRDEDILEISGSGIINRNPLCPDLPDQAGKEHGRSCFRFYLCIPVGCLDFHRYR